MSTPISIEKRKLHKNLNTLRNKGIVPGILYGQSLDESIPIQLSLIDLQSLISNASKATTFPLRLEDDTCSCILREFQVDPLCSTITHVDFQVVKPGELVKMNIPVEYSGLEHLRGKKLILEKSIAKLSVYGPVQNLPEAFVVDVGALDRGDKIFAHAIPLPSDTEILINPETIIATIQQ